MHAAEKRGMQGRSKARHAWPLDKHLAMLNQAFLHASASGWTVMKAVQRRYKSETAGVPLTPDSVG